MVAQEAEGLAIVITLDDKNIVGLTQANVIGIKAVDSLRRSRGS